MLSQRMAFPFELFFSLALVGKAQTPGSAGISHLLGFVCAPLIRKFHRCRAKRHLSRRLRPKIAIKFSHERAASLSRQRRVSFFVDYFWCEFVEQLTVE